MYTTYTLLLIAIVSAAPEPQQINPNPAAVRTETLRQWTFDEGMDGWIAERECSLSSGNGSLVIQSTGDDPHFHHTLDIPSGPLLLKLRVRGRAGGDGAIYWTTDRSPARGEDKSARFPIKHNGQWHETSVRFHAPGRLTDLRIDPGGAPGEVEIDWLHLIRELPNPLEITRVDTLDHCVRFTVANRDDQPKEYSLDGKRQSIAGGATQQIDLPKPAKRPLAPVTLELHTDDYPSLKRTVFVYQPRLHGENWIDLPDGKAAQTSVGSSTLPVRVAPDGSIVIIERDGQPTAILGPLVHFDGVMPDLKRVEGQGMLRFRGDDVELTLSRQGAEINVSIDSQQPCEGPVVRAFGPLEQGLFAGLEYLGKGERSSSKLDIETAEHLRFAPDPMKVTMPLMAAVTDRGSVAVTWADMQLQPVFATPNFFDGAADHRMALRGKRIEATVRVAGGPLEDAILWSVEKTGLPPLPEPPRSVDQQWKLCLAGLNGPLRTDEGWGHCVESRWERRPFADMASTQFRLTGQVPEMPQLVPGGAHVPNGTIYFVSGRARQWLDHKAAEVQGILRRQQPDGSFRYGGKYRRGHFEDTASGVCARPAATLLQYAWITGDEKVKAAGIRALEFMKRFRTPRGAQVWEVPLHTPDVLASAYLVWAYTRGYELTGNREYLDHARRWAVSGVPFIYLWSCRPVMLYGTVPVYGATNWRAPSWFGLPVQWCGGVYAYALTLLSEHDDSLDWNHLARGILLSAEQQQYPDGDYIGLLPDAFVLDTQERRPWTISPCALVSLRLALDGPVDFLDVATDGKHRVAAPFPVTIKDGAAEIDAPPGLAYQIIVDGSRVIDMQSKGKDVVPVD